MRTEKQDRCHHSLPSPGWGGGQNNLYREQLHETGGLLGVDVLKLSQELGMSLYQTHVQKNIFLNHVEAKKSW